MDTQAHLNDQSLFMSADGESYQMNQDKNK